MIPIKRRRGITGGEKTAVSLSVAPSDKFAQSRVEEDVGLVSSLQARRGPIFSALTNGPLICHGLVASSAITVSVLLVVRLMASQHTMALSHPPLVQDKRRQGVVPKQ